MVTLTHRRRAPDGPVPSPTASRPGLNERGLADLDATGHVTHERIQARAYEVYREREHDGTPGDAVSDWLQAERELNGSVPDPSAAIDVELKARSRGERLLACGD